MKDFKLNNLRELSTEEQQRIAGGGGTSGCKDATCSCSCTCSCDSSAPSRSSKSETYQLNDASVSQREVNKKMIAW